MNFRKYVKNFTEIKGITPWIEIKRKRLKTGNICKNT